MISPTLELLAQMAFAFGVVKTTFLFLGWYSQEDGDTLYRQHLDNLWDYLHKISVYNLIGRSLSKLTSRINTVIFSRAGGRLISLLILVIFNVTSAIAGTLVGHSYAYEFSRFLSLGYMFVLKYYTSYILDNSAQVILISVSGSILGLVSALITFKLIDLASRSPNLLKISIHLVVDIVVALAMILLVYILYVTFTFSPLAFELHGELGNASLTNTAQAVYKLILVAPGSVPGESLSIASVIIGLSSAIPSIMYLVLCSAILLIHFLPTSTKPFVMRCVHLVTMDDKPVLSQLGTALGGLAAILTGITKYLST